MQLTKGVSMKKVHLEAHSLRHVMAGRDNPACNVKGKTVSFSVAEKSFFITYKNFSRGKLLRYSRSTLWRK